MAKAWVIMKFFLFCILIFILTSQTTSQIIYWEDLSTEEQNRILNDPATYNVAVDYYNNKFIASDDSLTESLLDIILGMSTFNPLYLYDFNMILEKSDGALSEIIVDYVYLIIIYHPNAVMGYLTKDRLSKNSRNLCKLYANFFRWALPEKPNKALIEENIKILEKTLEEFKNSSSINKETVKLFLYYVDKAINSK